MIATCATCDARMVRLDTGEWRCPVDQRHGDRLWPDDPEEAPPADVEEPT